MFSRVRKHAQGRELVVASGGERPRRQPLPPSIVSSDLYVRGDVLSEGVVHVDGRVDGEIRARVVTIGVNGRVEGGIHCEELVVFGILNGRAEAARVFLMGGSRVVADIVHDHLRIEEGAIFEGSCRRKFAETQALSVDGDRRLDPFSA